MKHLIMFCFMCTCIVPVQAQFLKKLKEKVNNSIDKATGENKTQTDIEKKEDAASDQYSDATENNEKPIFVDAAPVNGKMVLKLKNGDRFWGGYITITGQPKKGDANANVLDFVNARVGSFYTAGEISNYAIYFDGQRLLNDQNIIPLRPEFISYDLNKTPFFTSTEGQAGTPDPMAAVAAIQAKGNKLTKEDEAQFAKTLGGQIVQPTFSFNNNGKTYGPFEGTGEKMLVLKSMVDGKPTAKFYGFGTEPHKIIEENKVVFYGLVQTEKGSFQAKDYIWTTLAPTYPSGFMAMAQGEKVNTFSNGKTVPVIKIAGIDNVFLFTSSKFFETFGTDSGRVVSIVTDKQHNQNNTSFDVYIDYKTALHFPAPITKEHLLIASNPAKSVLYNMHTLYYADGTKETIDNVGDAQLVSFNGKEYIVWFAMKKVADGHEIYVCQKGLE